MKDLRRATFQDKQKTCVDCGAPFIFTRGEQRYFASKPGLVEPKRCPDCRLKRKLTLMPEEVQNV
ncbi:hypothetical protein ES708_12118 [subsurface metagenome]